MNLFHTIVHFAPNRFDVTKLPTHLTNAQVQRLKDLHKETWYAAMNWGNSAQLAVQTELRQYCEQLNH